MSDHSEEERDSDNGVEPEESDIQKQIGELNRKHAVAMATIDSLNRMPDRTYVYVPRERHIIDIEKDGRLVDDFIEETDCVLRARSQSPPEQCDFVLSLLRGAALEEVRLRSDSEVDQVSDLFTYLREAFSDRRSGAQLLHDFYSRKQRESEGLLEFSHALSQALNHVLRQTPDAVPNMKVVLRDQFVEGVRDPALKRELRRWVRNKPDSSMVEVREEAYLWNMEEPTLNAKPSRIRSKVSDSERGACCTVISVGEHKPLTLDDVMQVVAEQGKQLSELTQAVMDLTTQKTHTFKPVSKARAPLRFTDDGKPICLKCQKEGHIARNCPQKRHAKNPAFTDAQGNERPRLL